MTTLANIIGPIGLPELIVLGLLGLLFFGRRLPEVGRNLGKGIVEFRRGLTNIERDIDEQASRPATPTAEQNALPKPPEGERVSQSQTTPFARESNSGYRVEG